MNSLFNDFTILIRFFVREILNFNKILLNISNSSILKNFLFSLISCCLLVHDTWSQKKSSIKVFYFLFRTILHLLITKPVSNLSTSQINKSWIVFNIQYPLIRCDARTQRVRNVRVSLTRPQWILFGFLTIGDRADEYWHRIPQEGKNPYLSCLNDWQLFNTISSRIKKKLNMSTNNKDL